MTRLARTKITIHERTVNARRAAAGDEEAALQYDGQATCAEDEVARAEWLARAEESRASARAWMESVSCGRVRKARKEVR